MKTNGNKNETSYNDVKTGPNISQRETSEFIRIKPNKSPIQETRNKPITRELHLHTFALNQSLSKTFGKEGNINEDGGRRESKGENRWQSAGGKIS